jgi:outer membrane lipoprotein LolB
MRWSGSTGFVGWLGTVAALLGLGGCATFAPLPAELPEDGFVVSGRLAVRTATDGLSANFRWQHAPGAFEIELWGPMGQGRSRLVGAENAVTLYAADGAVYLEPDADSAMRRWLGVTVPVAALTHWIKGEAAPGAAIEAETRDGSNDLLTLTQLSWQLAFSDYTMGSNGHRLPGRIVAERSDMRVTLLPRQWWFGAGTP